MAQMGSTSAILTIMPSWRREAAEPLPHVAVAKDEGFFPGHQVIDTAFDSVVEAMAAAVFVIVFGFGNGVVDVDGGDFQGASSQHFPAGDEPQWWFLR